MDRLSLLKETYGEITQQRAQIIKELQYWNDAVDDAQTSVTLKETDLSIATTVVDELNQKLLVTEGMLNSALPDRPQFLVDKYARLQAERKTTIENCDRQSKALKLCRDKLDSVRSHLAEAQKRMIEVEEQRDAAVREMERQRAVARN